MSARSAKKEDTRNHVNMKSCIVQQRHTLTFRESIHRTAGLNLREGIDQLGPLGEQLGGHLSQKGHPHLEAVQTVDHLLFDVLAAAVRVPLAGGGGSRTAAAAVASKTAVAVSTRGVESGGGGGAWIWMTV